MEEDFDQTSVSSQIRLNLLMAWGKTAGPRQSGVEINHHARFARADALKKDNVAKSGMRSWWCVAIIAPPGP